MLDQQLHAGSVFAYSIEKLKGGLAIAAPEPFAERLRRSRIGQPVQPQLPGLLHKARSHRAPRLAVPARSRCGHGHPQIEHRGDDFFADVQAVGQFAAEDADVPLRAVHFDLVLAR